jgi:hypothetical protein
MGITVVNACKTALAYNSEYNAISVKKKELEWRPKEVKINNRFKGPTIKDKTYKAFMPTIIS